MKKTALASLLAFALAAGCKKPPETETLLIAGSTTVKGYLDPVVKAFVAKNPTVNVVSEGGGGTAGLVALKHGAIDVATLSRAVKSDEDDPYLRDYLVARDGIAVVVNPSNPITDLKPRQLAKIFEGEITKWHEVSEHGEGNIVVVERDAKSHTRRSFEDLVMPGADAMPGARVAANAGELIDIVKSTPGAIGYLSLHKMSPAVKALQIEACTGDDCEKVEMSRMTMLSGRYPLARSFYLAVHMNGSPLADKFIQFALSKEGQTILEEDGLLATY
jgi:phosphate transport system substrate-binding protein